MEDAKKNNEILIADIEVKGGVDCSGKRDWEHTDDSPLSDCCGAPLDQGRCTDCKEMDRA